MGDFYPATRGSGAKIIGMKTLILLSMILGLSACVSAPKRILVWDLDPKDPVALAKFEAEKKRCLSLALALNQGDAYVDQCLILRGFNVVSVPNE